MTKTKGNPPNVFVVHGRNQHCLRRLLELLQRIGVDTHTLESVPKPGSPTVIELLEKWIPKADAVVVLMTPDDQGRLKGTRILQSRARQNVVFEAGCGLVLARHKTLVVEFGDVEHLSDMDGIHLAKDSRWSNTLEWRIAKRLRDMFPSVSLARALHFTNYATPIDKNEAALQYFHWRVFLDAPLEALREIERVTYKLHRTFPKSTKIRKNPHTRFALTTNGWGEFPIQIQVGFRNGDESSLEYSLDLTKGWPGRRRV